MMRRGIWALALASSIGGTLWAQSDTSSSAEDDFSQYDNLGFVDAGAKRFCSPKIEGLSPAKLISLGYDYQGAYNLSAGTLFNASGAELAAAEEARVNATQGLRVGFNIPVISKTNLVWQMGANYWNTQYQYATLPTAASNPLHQTLSEHGMRTTGINTTVFKPLDRKNFLLFQGSADLSGTYGIEFMPAQYLRYSAALIYGRRPTEKKQWGLGLARTYRVGEINYIPVVLYNSTDALNKWGAEVLFPARAHVRRTINPRNMIFAGYELEGQSYRLWRDPASGVDLRNEDLEIRRGEARFRMVYEFSLKDFIWLSVQAGYRFQYRFDVDRLVDGVEIYRAFGLLRDDAYAQTNGLGNPLYFNVSLNLVSP
ncbi:MAG: hypothetical protein CK537_03750 [Flavobacteriales bacterium]|nr:MAG: hypothetical protein CK537_03750 [Flavobacteriales bacterium]